MTTIRLLEELALNALPSLQTLYYDGWVLRRSEGASGYPRRANSIQLLYPSILPLDEKIDACEAYYSPCGCKTVFKMTPIAPDGLDARLRARGYVEDCPTSVQTLDLTNIDPQPDGEIEVRIEPIMSAEWAEANARLHHEDSIRSEVINTILKHVTEQCAFMQIKRDGATVALGRGTLDQGWIGPYEIIVDSRYRQQGLGRQLMLNILRWGKHRGAHDAYLQVIAANLPARRMYEKLGFREQYQYWYLQKAAPEPR